MYFAPTDPAVVEERWREVRERARLQAQALRQPPVQARNVRAVLDLGNMSYLSFRGRAYGVPPLPWKQGQRLLDLWIRVQRMGDSITQENQREYYDCLKDMTKVMWQCTRPLGIVFKISKKLKLLRNPYRLANEGEIVELALFYLGRRTKRTRRVLPGDGLPQATS